MTVARVGDGQDDVPATADAMPPADEALSALQRLIRHRLQEKGWSYGDVAKRAGLPRSTVYNLAVTPMLARPPKPQTLEGLARGLELPLAAVRGAAAEAAGFHYYVETHRDEETALLMASIDELGPEDRRHVAALVESLRRRDRADGSGAG